MDARLHYSRRHRAADPASPTFLNGEEVRMLAVDTARTVFRVIAPILVSGAQTSSGQLYSRILCDMIERHTREINRMSYASTKSSFYKQNVVIRMGDLYYWGRPGKDSIWHKAA